MNNAEEIIGDLQEMKDMLTVELDSIKTDLYALDAGLASRVNSIERKLDEMEEHVYCIRCLLDREFRAHRARTLVHMWLAAKELLPGSGKDEAATHRHVIDNLLDKIPGLSE